MYNHFNQYRCTIIRGKSKGEMDNLLPAYAQIIDEITPADKGSFEDSFNRLLKRFLPNASIKTLDNHRTEIAGKLFGMYYIDENQNVYTSERTLKFLEDNDQPAFFKDMCFKIQYPNGMDKPATILERINNNISVRPCSLVLSVLLEAKEVGLVLTKNDIGYYILNSLDALQGKAFPNEIVNVIVNDKNEGIIRKIRNPGKASSYNMQHINELLNYLELANLIHIGMEYEVLLNENELNAINYFAKHWDEKLEFDVYSYDLSTVENRKKIGTDWSLYFSKLVDSKEIFTTTAKSLGIPEEKLPKKSGRTDLVALGDEGELFVYEYEKERVKSYNHRLASKVLHLGKTRGLGYDIQSVIAEDGDISEFVKYIEVKSTKRVTAPSIEDDNWIDTINLTRNEWIAANQHSNYYFIYRVYFVRGTVFMYVIKNVKEKVDDGLLRVIPVAYRADFGNSAIDMVIKEARSEYSV
ncbi:MAG: DUF3883 domain-containing protein [Tissierellales bacterium]|nr:DUF3883 domain-containing protein [Acholeplasmataceae bacterium]MBN2827172.1 DUF3883 domain-containing protein [Tissierellales bacterium]